MATPVSEDAAGASPLLTPSSASASSQSPLASFLWMAMPPLYVAWRLYWATRMPIMDCDEVYNYWEPLAFVMATPNAGSNHEDTATAMQTWEYAHEYALRTYAYLIPLAQVGHVIQYLVSVVASSSSSLSASFALLLADHAVPTDQLATFVGLRLVLAATTSFSEILFLRALSQVVQGHVVAYTGLMMLMATGLSHAASAYLPSATWMTVWLLASTAFLYQSHYMFCIVAIVATLSVGWPFGVVLLIPMAARILWREWNLKSTRKGTRSKRSTTEDGVRRVVRLLGFCLLVTVAVQGAVMAIDYHYYGIWVSPTLNIFTYNAAGGGDELYGTEPASFYVKNLLLNLNLAAPLGLVVLPMLFFTQRRNNDLVILVLPLYLWLAITVPRPHKEERFLYPIYPLFCLGAVLTVDKTANFLGRLVSIVSRHKELSSQQRHFLHVLVASLMVLLSLSRTVAMVKYYSAPLQIYGSLAARIAAEESNSSPTSTAAMVCTCGEWYRFPSSFFLPPGTRLGFLESSFTGQLPQAFSMHGSKAASLEVLQPFNDQNKQEPSRYVLHEMCDWIVDLDDGACVTNPTSGIDDVDGHSTMMMQPVESVPFLDAGRTSALHRVLYIPYLHEKAVENGQVHYQKYLLYKMH